MATREHSTFSPDTHERAVTQALTRAHAVNWQVLVLVALLLLALITRFYDLGTRVMSHDESLHTYYSWRLFEYGEFSHTPLMHGPLLFHMIALSYFLFGDSDFSARLYPAVLGVLIVGFPWLFRRWMGRTGALIAAGLLLISPQMMYYNRYIREDTPTIFFTLVTVYAIVQYVDGVPTRRPAWLWLLAVGLIGMLASKEVAFIYVAIFGIFLVLYWLLRMVQDVGIRRRPSGSPTWEAPWPQRATGHALLLIVTGLFAVTVGSFLHLLLASVTAVPSAAWVIAPLFAVVYLPLALSGLVRRRRGGPSGGAASAIMSWLGHGRSAYYTLTAGLIIGAAVALWIVSVIYVIKPGDIWVQSTVRSETDLLYGQNATKEFAVETRFDGTMFVRLLTWVGLPLLGLLFWLFLSAVFVFPGRLALPWRTMLTVLLVALLVTGVLVMFERLSHVNETTGQPFAADPTAVQAPHGDQYDNTPIIVAWVLGTMITLAVIGTRLLTNLWDFLNRQPIFDVLIVIGALIFPWLTGFPLFWAGYNLEDYNPNSLDGRATLEATLPAVLPFLMVAAAVGLAWNWRRFLPAAAIFLGIFAFFFTTVFSNQYGLVTGMIGSLGYWLEQQAVRRGSQPQYYYLLTQLLVYEFLPSIGALGAGGFGLVKLWRWRRDRALDTLAAAEAEAAATEAGEEAPLPAEPTLAGAQGRAEALTLARDNPAPHSDGEPLPRLASPSDLAEEQARRVADRERIGGLPFLALTGWWAVAILFGLTIAGEKMPWLTTHITVPLILVAGWWLGQMADGVRWRALGVSGWLVLIGALPLALLTLGRGVLGLWGGRASFGGRSVEDLIASGSWLGALLVLGGAVYVIWRLGRPLGRGQLARVATLSAALVLAVLTARAAVLACFINYDYPTELLVYAHSGPAVKTVLGETDRIATITNEGATMRIVFDDESSWPFTWYFRNYTNYGYLRGEAGGVDSATLDGARVVVVGNKKVGDVRRILGDRYYEFGYIRLWWPMQEYFNLNYYRVTNVFSTDATNIAAPYYRQGMWDIWWSRDYSTYGQAMCIESKQFRCEGEANLGATDDERAAFRRSCEQAVVNECAADDRFAVNKWPVSDRMYFFVDKQIAAQVWDAGIGSSTVNIREPEYPEDRVFREVAAERTLGETAGMIGPRGIALDADGAIYVADTDRNRIAVFSPDGEFLRGLGDPATAPVGAGLRQPWGLDIGPDGLVYVADTWNNRVAVLTREGDLVRAWGHEGVPASDPSPEAMWGPRELKIGPDGLVYVADTGGKRIRVYTLEGEWQRDIGSGGTGLGQVDEPVGLAFNPISRELYVAEAWNKRIQVFDLAGIPLRTFEVNMWFRNRQSFNRPYLAFSPDGTLLYVVDMDDRHRIVAYNLAGQPAFSFNQADNLEAGVLGVRSPAGLAVDDAGRLYVVDAEQARVYVFPPPDVSGSLIPVAPADALAPLAPDAAGDGELPLPEGEAETGAEGPAGTGLLPAGSPNENWTPLAETVNGLAVVYVPGGCLPTIAGAQVCVSAFWLGQREVTNVEYAACVEAGACTPPADRTAYDADEYASAPVVGLTWAQASDYATWIGGRLPGEAQWEYAARGPAGWPYPWGEGEPACELANTQGCGGLLPVGGESRAAGESWVGARDLAGGVWEWTADWFASDPLAGLPNGVLDPPGPAAGTERAIRGGSWRAPADYAAATYREARDPALGFDDVGLRVVFPADAAPLPPAEG